MTCSYAMLHVLCRRLDSASCSRESAAPGWEMDASSWARRRAVSGLARKELYDDMIVVK